MKVKILLLSLILITLSAAKPKEKVRIFIAGDSTAQTYKPEKTLMCGWGQMLQAFFTEDVKVENRAMGGRSTKTFISEGRWDKILNDMQKGDFVFIQFGHNDASTNPERHASYEDYRKNIERMIQDVRAKKGNPVLLTSVVMRTFQKGNLVDDRLKAYPAITRELAEQYNVPLIDVNVKMRDLILTMGDEPSKALYMWLEPGMDPSKPDGSQDDTHLREAGAQKVAEFVVHDIQKQQLKGLAKYLK